MQNDKLLPCPFCGKEVEIHGGAEEWTPSFYDPDSGGDPYYINCECGLFFSIGVCDATDLVNAWNTRKPMERIVGEISLLERKQKKIMRETGINSEVFETVRIDEYVKLDEVLDIVKGGVDNAG